MPRRYIQPAFNKLNRIYITVFNHAYCLKISLNLSFVSRCILIYLHIDLYRESWGLHRIGYHSLKSSSVSSSKSYSRDVCLECRMPLIIKSICGRFLPHVLGGPKSKPLSRIIIKSY